MKKDTERVTVIEDTDIMNTPVSELVEGDYYLFHLTDSKVYIYKDGAIGVGSIDLQKEEYYYRVPYTTGTLQEFIEGLGDVDE